MGETLFVKHGSDLSDAERALQLDDDELDEIKEQSEREENN